MYTKVFNFLTPKVGGFVLECDHIDDKAKILNNISLEKVLLYSDMNRRQPNWVMI